MDVSENRINLSQALVDYFPKIHKQNASDWQMFSICWLLVAAIYEKSTKNYEHY